MNARSAAALRVVLASLLLGALADLLLRYVPWGINALLWTAAFLGVAWWTSSRFDAEGSRRRPSAFAAVCALVAAAGLLWRDSPVLAFLDGVLLAVFLPMLALRARGVRVTNAGISEIGAAIAFTGVQSTAGLPQLVFRDLSWQGVPRASIRRAGVILRGALLAAPAIVIFGTLLAAADEHFEKLLHDLILFRFDELAAHVIVTAVAAGVCAGFFRSLSLGGELPRIPRPPFVKLPTAETNVALAILNVLFAAFVVVQVRYLFSAPAGSLSQYARRGFFELVWVVALVLPMLLIVEWLVNKDEPRAVRTFRSLAGLQIALIFVIAASAWRRMQLYRDEFGLTRLRVFTTAFMLVLAGLLLWFALTVLTGRRHRFAAGALVTAVAAVAALHAVNPDARIVETNLARAAMGRRAFDAAYAATLSDDAAPVILAHAERFGAHLRPFLKRSRPIGWRTWNVSRARAIRAIRDYESKATPPIARP